MSGSWGQQLIGGINPATGVNVGGSVTGPLFDCPGGRMVYSAVGTFGGATVALNVLAPDGVTLLPVGASTNLTAAGYVVVDLAPGQVQAVITGGAPSGIFASIARVVA